MCPRNLLFALVVVSQQVNRAVGTHRQAYQETQWATSNRTDKMATALVRSNFLFMAGTCLQDKSGWGRVTCIFPAALSEFISYKVRDKDRKAYSREPARQQQGEALKLTDNEAILVALLVIPSAISVHLHTRLFPFARRFA